MVAETFGSLYSIAAGVSEKHGITWNHRYSPGISYFRLVRLHSCEALGVKGHMHISKLQQMHS